jgi:hypothetical protein
MPRGALLAACVLAATLHGARAWSAAPRTLMLAGDTLESVALRVDGAPRWRLDRVFYRTCITLSCRGSHVRALRARAGERGSCQAAKAAADSLTRVRRVCVLCVCGGVLQRYEAFTAETEEAVLAQRADALASGCAQPLLPQKVPCWPYCAAI